MTASRFPTTVNNDTTAKALHQATPSARPKDPASNTESFLGLILEFFCMFQNVSAQFTKQKVKTVDKKTPSFDGAILCKPISLF